MAGGKRGWIYVAVDSNHPDWCKIGETTNPENRLRGLDTGPVRGTVTMEKMVAVPNRKEWEEAFRTLLEDFRRPDTRDWFEVEVERVIPMLEVLESIVEVQLTVKDAHVLYLSKMHKPYRQIAKEVGTSGGNVSRIVRKLKNKGLLPEERDDAED